MISYRVWDEKFKAGFMTHHRAMNHNIKAYIFILVLLKLSRMALETFSLAACLTILLTKDSSELKLNSKLCSRHLS